MVTQTPDQLSHEQALELLPWHINSTLEPPMSELVARHVERCPSCREESAILANAIVALNTGEQSTANLDSRFSNLLGRIREYERSAHRDRRQSGDTVGQRLSNWLGLSQPRLQWAGTFALGLVVGVAAILVAMQSTDVSPDLPSDYAVHGVDDTAPLRLLVEFGRAPDAETLVRLKRATGPQARWRQQSDQQYLIELADKTTVKTVADIQSRLLTHDAVAAVTIDIAGGNKTPN